MKKAIVSGQRIWRFGLIAALGVWPQLVMAAAPPAGPQGPASTSDCGPAVGTPGLDAICKSGGGGLSGLINGIANWLTGLLSLVVVLIIIIAGVQMISSAGNSEAVKAARGRLTNAIIGLVTLIAMRLILTLLGVIK